MIALEDCIALCGLTEEEVLAIAEHEHLHEILAAANGILSEKSFDAVKLSAMPTIRALCCHRR